MLARIWRLVQKNARGRFLILLAVVLLSGPVELLGIGVTAELMGLVAAKGETLGKGPLSYLFELQGVVDPVSRLKSGLLWAMVALGGVHGFSIIKSVLSARFVCRQEAEVTSKLFHACLNQPYTWFLERNTAELHRILYSGNVVQSLLNTFISAITKVTLALTLVGAIVWVDPWIALCAGIAVCLSYAVVRAYTRNTLELRGRQAHKDDADRRLTAQEALTSIRFVKTTAREDFFTQRYQALSYSASKGMVFHGIYTSTVRAFLEWIAFGGILTLSVYMVLQADTLESILPRLTLYTMAGYRVIPAVHELFGLWSSFSFHSKFLEKVEALLSLDGEVETLEQSPVLGLRDSEYLVRLSNVRYTYPNSDREVLTDFSVDISRGQWLGVVGPTGAGKTTLLDLLTGLCLPDSGSVHVGNSLLTSEVLKSWQTEIGVVPQEVILLDDSVIRNVAFGVAPSEIDLELVNEVVQLAGLEEFLSKLPDGLETRLGERGTRLSGGERQRVGLARALYRKPVLLLLDEATSALDQETEARIVETLQNLSNECTMITVAHRLSSVRPCDNILVLEDGELVSQGTFDELLQESETFKRIALSKKAK